MSGDQQQQGRGRARGRAARGQQQPQPQTTGRAVTRGQPPAGAAAPPPGFRQQRPPQQQQQPPPQLQATTGRAAHRGAGAASEAAGLHTKFSSLSVAAAGASGDNGGGGNGTQIGRGAMRGRRPIGQAETGFVRTRPDTCETKQGISGDRLILKANYFKILTDPNYTLYQYTVDMAPEEDRTVIRRGLLRVHQNSIGPGYIFDGTNLYTFRKLAPDPLQLFSKRESDDVNIQITIRLTGDVRKGDHHYLQIYNIIIRKCLRQLDLQLLNRNYYDPKARKMIPQFQLELWPGYITSMRQHDGGILLCTEIIHKVLRQDTAYDILESISTRDPANYKRSFLAEIIGQIVLTNYGNTKTYRVDDVNFNATPMSTFDMRGKQISYVEYYQSKYGVKIRNTKQPLILSMPKAREQRSGQDGPIYLIPELCQMTGITDKMRANNNLMRAMADETRMGADLRQKRLLEFNARFHSVKAIIDELSNWELKLDTQLVTFSGRRLPPEKIVQGNNMMYPAENVDWTNRLRSNPLLLPGVLDHWVVITMRRIVKETQSFLEMIIKAARGMNFRIEYPKVEEINDDRAGPIIESLDKVLSRENPKLVLCVVSNNKGDRYSAIKKKTNVDRAVPSQVICANTMTRKGAMSIATKVAIQLSCKIGGAPWSVDMPLAGLMVVGYDVCHDSQKKEKSYGAMVASLNKPLSRYFSTVTAHTSGEEVFNDLALNVGKAVLKYRQVNGALPQRICIYRDGVGEGQLPVVLTHEVEHVKSALNEIYQGQPIRMVFIVVTKRLNTRLFYGNDNPPAGTVVDDCVTHPEKYDFFLVSQSVRQGSVSPTGYNIVYDTIGLEPDKLQRLSYKMTHLYYNWSGTVRVPAPCQYAHKLAFLVGQNLHRPPNVELEDLLYFL